MISYHAGSFKRNNKKALVPNLSKSGLTEWTSLFDSKNFTSSGTVSRYKGDFDSLVDYRASEVKAIFDEAAKETELRMSAIISAGRIYYSIAGRFGGTNYKIGDRDFGLAARARYLARVLYSTASGVSLLSLLQSYGTLKKVTADQVQEVLAYTRGDFGPLTSVEIEKMEKFYNDVVSQKIQPNDNELVVACLIQFKILKAFYEAFSDKKQGFELTYTTTVDIPALTSASTVATGLQKLLGFDIQRRAILAVYRKFLSENTMSNLFSPAMDGRSFLLKKEGLTSFSSAVISVAKDYASEITDFNSSAAVIAENLDSLIVRQLILRDQKKPFEAKVLKLASLVGTSSDVTINLTNLEAESNQQLTIIKPHLDKFLSTVERFYTFVPYEGGLGSIEGSILNSRPSEVYAHVRDGGQVVVDNLTFHSKWHEPIVLRTANISSKNGELFFDHGKTGLSPTETIHKAVYDPSETESVATQLFDSSLRLGALSSESLDKFAVPQAWVNNPKVTVTPFVTSFASAKGTSTVADGSLNVNGMTLDHARSLVKARCKFLEIVEVPVSGSAKVHVNVVYRAATFLLPNKTSVVKVPGLSSSAHPTSFGFAEIDIDSTTSISKLLFALPLTCFRSMSDVVGSDTLAGMYQAQCALLGAIGVNKNESLVSHSNADIVSQFNLASLVETPGGKRASLTFGPISPFEKSVKSVTTLRRFYETNRYITFDLLVTRDMLNETVLAELDATGEVKRNLLKTGLYAVSVRKASYGKDLNAKEGKFHPLHALWVAYSGKATSEDVVKGKTTAAGSKSLAQSADLGSESGSGEEEVLVSAQEKTTFYILSLAVDMYYYLYANGYTIYSLEDEDGQSKVTFELKFNNDALNARVEDSTVFLSQGGQPVNVTALFASGESGYPSQFEFIVSHILRMALATHCAKTGMQVDPSTARQIESAQKALDVYKEWLEQTGLGSLQNVSINGKTLFPNSISKAIDSIKTALSADTAIAIADMHAAVFSYDWNRVALNLINNWYLTEIEDLQATYAVSGRFITNFARSKASIGNSYENVVRPEVGSLLGDVAYSHILSIMSSSVVLQA